MSGVLHPAMTAIALSVLLAGCNGRAPATQPDGSPRRIRAGEIAQKKTAMPRNHRADTDAADGPGDAGDRSSKVTLRAIDGEVTVQVEVVKTQQTRTRGLMFREHLDDDAGMLFLFRQPEEQSFWMRNTYIPLDMVFIGSNHRVVGVVENAEPRTLTSRRVDGLSQFVLEVNAGFARRYGVGTGTAVQFVNVDQTGVDP